MSFVLYSVQCTPRQTASNSSHTFVSDICAFLAGDMLNNLTAVVPELNEFANLQLKVAFNKDSSRVGPKEWTELAQLLHNNRKHYDAFLVVHGTDTMADTASALSLMLLGFRKPIVLTGMLHSACSKVLPGA